MKVAGYIRVSTDVQAEKGLGLDIQGRAIRTWAKANGCRLTEIYTDAGKSGSNGLDSRLGLADALEAIRAERLAGLVVLRLDRLARDLIVQETVLAEVKRMGAKVFSTMPAEAEFLVDDPAGPSRKLIRQVLGAVAEYERAMTVLRLQGGRRRKAERGGFAYGSPAFGQQSVDAQLVDEPGEQATIVRIREMHAAGASLREMAATLTAEGHQPKRADRWHPQSLARIVARL